MNSLLRFILRSFTKVSIIARVCDYLPTLIISVIKIMKFGVR